MLTPCSAGGKGRRHHLVHEAVTSARTPKLVRVALAQGLRQPQAHDVIGMMRNLEGGGAQQPQSTDAVSQLRSLGVTVYETGLRPIFLGLRIDLWTACASAAR